MNYLTPLALLLLLKMLIVSTKITCPSAPQKIPLKFQCAVVVDRTYEFLSDSSGYISMVKYLLLDLADEFAKMFLETDFAVSSFTNYHDLRLDKGIRIKDSCYQINVPFSNQNPLSLVEKINQLLSTGGSNWSSVSALSAAVNTVVDTNINWEPITDRTTVKAIILITDKKVIDRASDASFHANLADLKEDGSTVPCEHKVPSFMQIGDILRKFNIFTIGLFHLDILAKWEHVLNNVVPKRSYALSFLDDWEIVVEDAMKKMRKLVCQDFSDDFHKRKLGPLKPNITTTTERTTTTKRPDPNVAEVEDLPFNTLGPRFLPM